MDKKQDTHNLTSTLSPKTKKIVGIASIVVLVGFMAAIFWFVGRPILQFASQPEQFRAWVQSRGIWGHLAFVGMMLLQVIVAIIPGEPLEIGAGYAFGAIEGTLLCIGAIVIGSGIIFLLVRRFGVKFIELFFPIEKIRSIKILSNPTKLNLTAFIVFFIPGTPKDLLSYLVGLTDMKFTHWLLISGIARIPSVVTSTISGNALGLGQYWFAAITFGITAVLGIAGIFIFNRMNKKHDTQNEKSNNDT